MFLKLFKCYLILIFFVYISTICCKSIENPQVFIDNEDFKGSILGKNIQESGVEYIAFRGIPYAKAPINEFRFKDPQKLDKFEGILDARYDGYECHSITAKNGSEDCLNLNVYTKQLNPLKLLPVVVLLHPGGLYLGSASSAFMRPQHMLIQNWLVVTCNYRLGSLGFLNLGSADIPGNAGFKDQVYALRWVQKYIKYFGGNPNDITLMGYSAGALSVQLHLMSAMSKDLFHKAIIMSGSLAPQTYIAQQQRYLAIRLAKHLKCEKFLHVEQEIPYGKDLRFSNYGTIQNSDILECLKPYNGSTIANSLRALFDFPKDNPIFLWLPVWEKDYGQERFLTENFIVQKKNILIGYTNGELCESAKYILENETIKSEFMRDFKILAPRFFMYERYTQRDQITLDILRKYLNNSQNLSHQNYDDLCDLFSDSIIRFGAHKLADFMIENKVLVYFYEFAFMEDYNTRSDAMFPNKKARCEHMQDFQYLFNWPGDKHDSEKQRHIIELYTRFLYDFVINGKLSDPQAKPYPETYALIKESVEYRKGRNFDNYDFWLKHFPDYFIK